MLLKHKEYLSGLNTLRFFAAFLVIISHAQLSIAKLNIYTGNLFPILEKGMDSVEFFFVLSGFLITYLLNKELAKKNTISIKDFYLRRVFRIWPLYFLIILIGIILLVIIFPSIFHKPFFDFPIWKWLILYVFFLPNLATSFFPMGMLNPLWSIGVEEQFYLFWAPVVKIFKNKLLVIIYIFICISFLQQIFAAVNLLKIDDRWIKFMISQKYYAMSIGCYFGYVFFNRKAQFIQSIFSHSFVQYLVLLAILIHLFMKLPYSDTFVYHFILSMLFGLLIINTVCAEKTILKLEIPFFSYLGTISYGLYMYHMSIDYLLRTIVSKFNLSNYNQFVISFTYTIILLSLTICFSSFSYKYIESYFLRIKSRLEK